MSEAIRAAIGAALLHFVWQGAVVSLILWAALWPLRTAAARYAVCCAALGAMILLPLATASLLYEPPGAAVPHVSFAFTVPLRFPASRADTPDWLGQSRGWVLPVWALGVALFSLRMAWGWAQAAWLRRRGTSAGDELAALATRLASRTGVSRSFRVLISRTADGPGVIGWLHPVILIPAAALAGLTPEQLEAVLAHELAHIRRADYLVNLLQSAVETLLFYHPAVWWVSSRVRRERELCCDDLAVRTCGDALVYARALSVLGTLRIRATRLAVAGTGGELLYRIQRIVGIEPHPAQSKSPVLLALSIVLVAGLMGLTRAHAEQVVPRPEPVQTAQTETAAVQAPAISAEHPTEEARRKAEAQDRLAQLMRQLFQLRQEVAVDAESRKALSRRTLEVETAMAEQEKIVGSSAANGFRRAPDYAALLAELNVKVEEALRQPHTPEQEEFLENQLETLRAELARAPIFAPDGAKERFELRQVEEELRAALDQRKAELMRRLDQADPGAAEAPEVGGIVFTGVPPAAENELRTRLPVKAGERLSSRALRDSYTVVSGYDQRLDLSVFMVGEGKAEIRISAR
jgi:beta-lactamase regulating signal transducer with metallopeptidase domain